jgi:putative DNA methylase
MPRKLIEVALPLDAINKEASREKFIRHGHPSNLHLWWARRPLATARAVLFASLVDDPGEHLPEDQAAKERERLFALLEKLVNWDEAKDPDSPILWEARHEMAKSLARILGKVPPPREDRAAILALLQEAPPVLDPFAGGGTIPLEAQRLGLIAYASDLNPVAVLLNKALIEIPPRFAGLPPVNPEYQARRQPTDGFPRARGLAEDVRFYGRWMREEAFRRIGAFYPTLSGQTVIAWLWARTVACPNPACRAEAPLVRSFWLSKKRGKEAYVVPEVDEGGVMFRVKTGAGAPPLEGTVNRRGARCLVCGTPIPLEQVRAEGRAGRMGARLMAIVTEEARGRGYHAPDPEHEALAKCVKLSWKPETLLPTEALGFRVQKYGLTTHADLFTPRQLLALSTFSDLLEEAEERAYQDSLRAGLPDDPTPLAQGGRGARAYAQAVRVYLALAVDRLAESGNTLSRWQSAGDKVAGAFGRQALPMVWDYAEVNPFSGSTRNLMDAVEWVAESLEILPTSPPGTARQVNALDLVNGAPSPPLVSTDPPYYDNVAYADLSDFFYVWLRRNLKEVYPDLFRTLLTPKAEELIADPFRHGGKEEARRHFEEGMRRVFRHLRERAHPDYPVTLYYAFKQQEVEEVEEDEEREAEAVASTGWETFLQGLVEEGFQVVATWPMRTERANRLRGLGANALASSIVLVCRPRPKEASLATRQDFLRALRAELPRALRDLTRGSIPPVDLAQSAIGPGMAVFSRYRALVEPDGRPLSVREALALINQVLDEFLAEEEAELDAASRFALAWYEQYGYGEGPYGDAETLAKAKNVAVAALEEGGILLARGGKVRLLKPEEYPEGWDPKGDRRLSAWEAAHHLIHLLEREGEGTAARLLAELSPTLAEGARALAYRLYQIAERKGRAEDAQGFNLLAASYGHLAVEAARRRGAVQEGLFE